MNVFGGPVWPIGWTIGFLERPLDAVLEAMRAWHAGLGIAETETPSRGALLDRLERLAPLQTPWTRELVMAVQPGWTACFTNDHLGGDPVSWCGHLSSVLGCPAVVATHIPGDQYPYPATAFALLGPQGAPPLRYVRTITCGVHDEGRWRFEARGPPQPFERTARYGTRRVRDRFDREMLLGYLAALGIRADEPAVYGEGVLFARRTPLLGGPRTTSLERFQAEHRRG